MRAAKRIAAQRLVQFMTDLARSFEPKVESGEYTFRMKSYLRGAE